MTIDKSTITNVIKRQPGSLPVKMHPVVVASTIILGLTLLVSGTGKLPGQTEFIDALLKSFWTPFVAYVIGYCLPWIEVGLGILLLLGIFPRIVAIICVPIIIGFMVNNSWALMRGVEDFSECSNCFGVWEEFVGTLSPLGALVFDFVILCLALIILLFHQKGFFTFQPWFMRRKRMGDCHENISRSGKTTS